MSGEICDLIVVIVKQNWSLAENTEQKAGNINTINLWVTRRDMGNKLFSIEFVPLIREGKEQTGSVSWL